jgi:hypothetical protein
MTANPLRQLAALDNSPWIDFIARDAIRSGKLAGWIAEGLRSMTSNPTSFEVAGGHRRPGRRRRVARRPRRQRRPRWLRQHRGVAAARARHRGDHRARTRARSRRRSRAPTS